MNIPLRGVALTNENAHLNMLKVRSNYNPDMSVYVAPGGMWFDSSTYVESVGAVSPIFTTPTISGESSINFVCLHRSEDIRIIEGTPSTDPIVPDILFDYIPLAMIYLTEGDTTIKKNMIFDIRPVFSSNIFTNTHQTLADVTFSDCHPISSITNLQTELDDRVITSTYLTGLSTKSDLDGTSSTSFSLNKGVVTPISDIYLTVERGTGTNVHIKWNESSNRWEFTNNGTTWYYLDTGISLSLFDFTEVDPSDFTGSSPGDILIVNGTSTAFEFATLSYSIFDLTNVTPTDFSGTTQGDVLAVDAAGTGIEWITPSPGVISIFGLSDVTPSDFTGASPGDILVVNGSSTSLEWDTISSSIFDLTEIDELDFTSTSQGDVLMVDVTGSSLEWGTTTIGYLAGETILAGSGIINLPGYAFSTDPDTGFYRVSTGNVAYVSDGIRVLDINASGLYLDSGVRINKFSDDGTLAGDLDTTIPTEKAIKQYVDDTVGQGIHGFLSGDIIEAADGTVAAPGFTFRHNLDNGMFFNSITKEIGFSTSGIERLRIDFEGKIGIGTSSPDDYYASGNTLVINTTDNTGISIVSGQTNYASIFFADGISGTEPREGYIAYQHTDNKMYFGANHTAVMDIDENGLYLTTGARIVEFSTDITLSGNSNTAVPTEAAVLGYITSFGFSFLSPGDTILAALGTEGAPGYTFDSDTDSGIYCDGANGIGISTGGSNSMWFDASGNIGIGTISPSGYYNIANNLVVYDASSTGITITSGTSSFGTLCFADGVTTTDAYEGYIQYDHSSNDMTFGTNHTTALIIDNSGNIGIGTEIPSSYNSNANNLVVYEAGNTGLTIVSGATNSGSIYFADGTTTTDAYEGYITYNHSINSMVFGANHTDAMTINNSGNISFTSGVSVNQILDENNMSTDSATALATQQSIKKYVDDNTYGYIAGDTILANSGTVGAPGFSFNLNSNNGIYLPSVDALGIVTAGTEVIRIDNFGNVGIGTNTPAIYNSVANNLVVCNVGASGISIVSGSTNTGSIFFADGTSGDALYEGGIQYNHNENKLVLYSNHTEAITIDGSQNTIFNGDIIGNGDTNIVLNTLDSSDDGILFLGGGGAPEADRGGCISFHGNEESVNPGDVRLSTGTVVGGEFIIFTTGIERLKVSQTGDFELGNNGISVTEILDEDAMTSDSATALATQQSIKKYVDDNVSGSGYTAGDTILAADGTQAAPGFAFNSDTNTGMYLHSANSIAFSTNSQSRMRISTAGNVGIGGFNPDDFTTPANNLVIWEANDNGITIYTTSPGTDGFIVFADGTATTDAYEGFIKYDHVEDRMHIGTNHTDALIIDSDQHVGLGINTPSNYNDDADNLVICEAGNAGITISTGTADTGSIFFADGIATDPSHEGYINYDHVEDRMHIGTNHTDALIIDSDQHVGLGINTPSNYNDDADNLVICEAGNAGITISTGTVDTGSIFFADGIATDPSHEGYINYDHSSDTMSFGASHATQMNLTSSGLQIGSSARIDEFSIDGTLAGDSDTAIPTEKAVKTYIDTETPNVVVEANVPASAPDKEGDIFIDTSGGGIYISNGTTDSDDWKQVLAG